GRLAGVAPRPGGRRLCQPDRGVGLAGRAVAALPRLALRDGVPIRARTPVLGIEPGADRVVLRTPAGEISAAVAVVAAGPWSERVPARAPAPAPPLTVTPPPLRSFRPGAGA